MNNLYQPTAQDIIDLLPIVANRKWISNASYSEQHTDKDLVRTDTGICPLCALANEIIGQEKFVDDAGCAMIEIGAIAHWCDNSDSMEIIGAADNFPGREALRVRLLQALNLT